MAPQMLVVLLSAVKVESIPLNPEIFRLPDNLPRAEQSNI